ncbi:hypothetical protein PPERSA_05402 [Pseudocohnilembus persalinus]|uniref:PCI domain-containing protein n=1 Tax=Pseudocohnilembus persalinus TaxID=266149 RepID=A0A0V0R7X0_PSEPJ|nr:hypothetical protein PPERSA_05402 [Pseudocohnilembus persalinus]|eukprot:KRX10582.1 hypothetical protein PPERSA_05402 [Pseudocohnilembus persalinus]
MSNYYEQQHEQALKLFQDGYNTDKNIAWNQLYQKLLQPKRWSVTLETMMKLFIQASVELEKYSDIKNVLRMYKMITQTEFTDSLNLILSYYKSNIENKFKESIKDVHVPKDLGDVDLQESPEELIILNYNPEEKIKRDQIKALIKMRIECYKSIIETIKTNSKCLELFQKTVDAALQFLEKYNRSSELTKLVSLITALYPSIKKTEGLRKKVPTYINLADRETQTIQLEVRFKVYDLCKKLGQGQNQLKLMEDIKNLIKERFQKKDEKKRFLSMYYEALSEIFRNSHYYNFHAIFFFKHFEYFIKYSAQEEKVNQQKADQVTLAVLSIPFNAIDLRLSTEKFQKVKEFILDPYKYIPSQAELIQQLKSQNIIDLCSPEVQELYNLIAGNINIFSISQNFVKISQSLTQYKEDYLDLLQQNVVFKVLKQLSQIYSTIKIERVQEIIGFYDEGRIISLMLEAGNIAHINCNIDFTKNIILFGRTNKVESASGTLCLFAEKCKKMCLDFAEDAPVSKKLKNECKEYLENSDVVLQNRASRIKNIKALIKRAQDQEYKKEYLQQQELERLEREKIAREIKRQKLLEDQRKAQITDHLRQINTKIEEIKKIKGKFETKIGGVKIEDMTDQEKLECDIESFNELKESVQEMLKNDVEDRAKKMFQKFDYISRELRQFEQKSVTEIQENQGELDQAVKISQEKFNKDKELKQEIIKTKQFKEKFFQKVIEMREKKFQDNLQKYKEYCESFRPDIQQKALEKLNDWKIQQEIEEEEKRKKQEEEKEFNLQNQEKQQDIQISRNRNAVPDVIQPQDSDEEEKKENKNVFKRGTGAGVQATVSEDRQSNFQKSDKDMGFKRGEIKREEPKKEENAGWGKGKNIVSDKKEEPKKMFGKQQEKADDGFTMVRKKVDTKKTESKPESKFFKGKGAFSQQESEKSSQQQSKPSGGAFTKGKGRNFN